VYLLSFCCQYLLNLPTSAKKAPQAIAELVNEVQDIDERIEAVGLGPGELEGLQRFGHYDSLIGRGPRKKTASFVLTCSPYVEDLTLPDLSEDHHPLMLPQTARAQQVLEEVAREKEQEFLTPAARALLTRWLVRQDNVHMLTTLFWWFCADLFKRGDPGAEKLKAVLQSKFAKQYVNLNLPGTSTNRPTDQQMRIYNSALADSLTQMMRNCFHKSAHRFDKDFHEHIKCQILEWTSGVLPYGVRFSPENVPRGAVAALELEKAKESMQAPARQAAPTHPAVGSTNSDRGSAHSHKSSRRNGAAPWDTFALTQVGLEQGEETASANAVAATASSSKKSQPWGPGGERRELFDLSQTSPFVGSVMAEYNLKPAQRPPVKVSRTVAPASRELSGEESYKSFAKSVAESHTGVQDYKQAGSSLKSDIRRARGKLKEEIEELELYREMVTAGANTRNFSNWLSGWSDAEKAVKEEDLEKNRRNANRVAVVVQKRTGGGGTIKKHDAQDKIARAQARNKAGLF